MLGKIVVMKDSTILKEIVLSKESTVIGRKKECDISVTDSAVSGVHGRVLRVGDKYQIKDMSSTNGIHLHGRRIQQQILKDGDIILVGEHQLKFVEGKFVDTSTLEIPNPVKKKSDKAAPPTSPIEQPASLLILSGRNKNQQIDLTEPLTSVGVPGIQVAAISQRPQGHFIVHVDGGKDRNRVPTVNGDPIGFRSRKLEHGDKIEVADIEMEYLLSDITVIKLS